MTKTTKKSSAKRKLIPAVGMLTTSAIMLSSATYAWFTMNKEVEVTGLKMAAVAGDSLEITLGKLGVTTTGEKSAGVPDNTTFGSVEDLGWVRAEAVASYYSVISKLKPASSNNALSIYKVQEEKIYAGGQAVEDSATVSVASTSDMPTISLDTTYHVDDLTNESDTAKDGYYVDIPMWIRSSNLTSRKVNAYVKIDDPNDSNGSDLINAIRVALIPIDTTTDLSSASNLGYTTTASWTGKNSYIFGLTDTTYNSKVLNAGGENATYGTSLGTSNTINQAASNFGTVSETDKTFKATYNSSDVSAVSIFDMPAATNDKYAAALVVARIWIEGESTHCNDATANQDWNIDFRFELGEEVTPPSP